MWYALGMVDIGVILLNMGGPRNPSEVKPFLREMFRDPNLIQMPFKRVLAPVIIALRAPVARRHYAAIDGGSPLFETTHAQAEQLEQTLNADGADRFRVVVGMRYTAPTTGQAVRSLASMKCGLIIGLSMYPQYCIATTGSSISALERAVAQEDTSARCHIIDRYYDHPGYIDAVAKTIRRATPHAGKGRFVLFSAHGVPMRMVRDGDPYVDETRATVDAVASRLNLDKGDFGLAFQSRVGPVKWVGPSSEAAIATIASSGVEELVIVPVSFTADNLETLYDIEIVLRKRAETLGIDRVIRVPALNIEQAFIDTLADLVHDQVAKAMSSK
ncbi:MAG: ferrochelatase [Myxococcota bacterium]|nr:ferrochelatase [Myxococcota bacterium]